MYYATTTIVARTVHVLSASVATMTPVVSIVLKACGICSVFHVYKLHNYCVEWSKHFINSMTEFMIIIHQQFV